MTPADRRITELIDKWLASIDLHLQYVDLNDAAYAQVQPWPRHDRPTRWVLEVAKQKILELKGHCESRRAMGDARFSESLELMAFLANLVGVQHIQRFIPLAEPSRAAPTSVAAGGVPPRTHDDPPTRPLRGPRATTKAHSQPAAAAQAPAAPSPPAAASPQSTRAADGKTAARNAAAPKGGGNAVLEGKIIADAVRLLKWGKPWHELAELIERIAERPPATEIRKVLRAHRTEIEKKAAAAAK